MLVFFFKNWKLEYELAELYIIVNKLHDYSMFKKRKNNEYVKYDLE